MPSTSGKSTLDSLIFLHWCQTVELLESKIWCSRDEDKSVLVGDLFMTVVENSIYLIIVRLFGFDFLVENVCASKRHNRLLMFFDIVVMTM